MSDYCSDCEALEDRLSGYERKLSELQSELIKKFASLKQSEVIGLHEQIHQAKEGRAAIKLALHRHRFQYHNGDYDHG